MIDAPDPSIETDKTPGERPYSLYEREEDVIRQTESMLLKLDEVAKGVQRLARAYREGYRETVRLIRISDRMQAELQTANRLLASQAADLQRLNQALQEEIQRREALERELRRIASIDALTETYTRRHLLELGGHEQRRRARHDQPLSLLLLDLDHFKHINDRFGHAAGDQVLRDFGALLRTHLRQGDIAGRFGGEEFLVILPDTDLETAATIAERLCALVRQSPSRWQGQDLSLTVSIGVVSVRPDEPLESAVRRADKCLYRAKGEGRDRVVIEGLEG